MKQFTHKYDESNVVRSILKDDGTMVYVLRDIAECICYKAPNKFAERSPYDKEKVTVKWKNGVRVGQSEMWAVTYESFLKIAEHHWFPKEIVDFIKEIENHDFTC